MNKKAENPWKPEDEREHLPSVLEWWAVEVFFKTVGDSKRWSFKGVLTEWFDDEDDNGSLVNMTLFDEKRGEHFACYIRTDKKKLEVEKDRLEIKYKDCFLKGEFPKYIMRFVDKENNIELDMTFNSTSIPRWIAQDITNGLLPMGLGMYRYGFIPKNSVSGNLTIKGEKYKIGGEGYYEHVWGNFLYDDPLAHLSEIKKVIPLYFKLIFWWLENHKLKIPESIRFCTENNPFGYDWAWGLFDNGWTVYYGNFLFWLANGPVMGTLILTKDGENYKEFSDVNFKYNRIKHSKNYDFDYPTDIEVEAKDGKETMHLRFKMTSETREYVSKFKKNKFWKSFVLCEAPGFVEGYYSDGEKKIKLKGKAKIEPQRQISIIGHNSLSIYFLKPPKGVGLSIHINSNLLNRKINATIQLAPYLSFKFNSRSYSRNKK
jgi:hypothetical protein